MSNAQLAHAGDETAVYGLMAEAVCNMPAHEYRADPAWSVSQVNLLPEQPELFYGYHVAKPPLWERPATPNMDRGTILHACLLDGADLDAFIIPAHVLSSNGSRAGKAWQRWKETRGDDPCIKDSEADDLRQMIASVRAEPQAAKLLDAPGGVEVSLFATDEPTGLRLKGRIDKLAKLKDTLVVVDLKTTSDPTDRAFSRSLIDYGYHRQAAWYLDLVAGPDVPVDELPPFVFICVRNEPPYECRVWELASSAIALGREKNREALIDLAKRLASDNWRGPQFNTIPLIDLPRWVYRGE